jgi:hypothetical protein
LRTSEIVVYFIIPADKCFGVEVATSGSVITPSFFSSRPSHYRRISSEIVPHRDNGINLLLDSGLGAPKYPVVIAVEPIKLFQSSAGDPAKIPSKSSGR